MRVTHLYTIEYMGKCVTTHRWLASNPSSDNENPMVVTMVNRSRMKRTEMATFIPRLLLNNAKTDHHRLSMFAMRIENIV